MTENLSVEHLAMLQQGSGITPEVIAARGYRTITIAHDLVALGFAKSQLRAPGLLLPLHPTDGGDPPLYVYRPDTARSPRDRVTGEVLRTIKYELPVGAGTRLDCPPVCQPRLADPTVPLWITEGQKKGDALASRGLCAIALLGVWNWKGRNDAGGTTFLTDWDYIALDGRQVRIVFDSDVMTKPAVRQALDRLTAHLQRKGAQVTAVYLPQADGHKVGVDDWLVAGHTVEDLEGLVEAPRPTLKAAAAGVELLDAAPATMRRPLCIIGEHAYAAAWLPCRVTVRERREANGTIRVLNPPEVVNETRLFIVRDDGVIFGDGGDQPLSEIGFDVKLAEVPRPEKTLSTIAVKEYRAGLRPNPLAVFGRVADVIGRFLDFERSLSDQRTMTEMTACYVLASWLLDAFTVCGFLWPNGDRGTGKTHLLLVTTELGYLGTFVTAGGSFAALRDLADYGAMIGFDDAEAVNDPKRFDPDKRSLLLAGNRRGATVPLKEPSGPNSWRTRYVDAFCPRLFSAIRLPDPILASRTIVVPLIRSADRARTNADPLDYTRWPHDRRLLIDDLWRMGLAHLRDLRAYDLQVAEHAGLSGRMLQPWRAILAVARWLDEAGADGLFARMDALSLSYQQERPDLELSDITVLVLKALQGLASDTYDTNDTYDTKKERGLNRFFVWSTKEVRERLDTLAEQEEIDPGWMGEPASRTMRVGRILGSLRLEKAHTGKARRWRVQSDQLERLLVSYALINPDPLSFLVSQASLVSQVSQPPLPEPAQSEMVDNAPAGAFQGADQHGDSALGEGLAEWRREVATMA